LKLKSAQSDYYGGQINFVRRIEYWYCDTYTRDQGVTTYVRVSTPYVCTSP